MRRSTRSARPNETRNRISAEPITEGLSIQLRGNGQRNFASVTDDTLVEIARTFMREKGITTREGVKKADSGLESVLRRRNLLGQVIPESANELHRDWVGMSDERIVEFTQEFMKEKGITTREGVKKEDSGLESVLRRRNLLERVFADIDNINSKRGLDAVCEALEEFGEGG